MSAPRAPITMFKGVTTKRLYSFGGYQNLPATLVDANGNPATSGAFNGEVCVWTMSRDGSLPRGTAGAQPGGISTQSGVEPNVYDQYAAMSAWEKS